jgi:hypothetical protein
MLCRLCNTHLAPLRILEYGEFCSDEHRLEFQAEQDRIEAASIPAPTPSISQRGTIASVAPVFRAPMGSPEPAPFSLEVAVPSGQSMGGPSATSGAAFPQGKRLLPLHFKLRLSSPSPAVTAGLPEGPFFTQNVLPWMAPPALMLDADFPQSGDLPALPVRKLLGSWSWIKDAWLSSPTDLRTMALLVPVLLAVAVSGSVPKVSLPSASNGSMHQMVNERFKNFHQTISSRAAVAFADDFRSGLDAWDSRSNLTTSWSYDASGFVQPGPLAIFKPTVEMADYRFEFLGEIDQKGLGCAFRAADLKNFYAVKFVVVKPGPLPLVHLVRYAVINGKEGPHMEKPLPLTVRKDMLYRVMLDVHGSDYTIMAQGQVVDFWSDSRLQHGGVGFFCGRGEKARVRWVEVSHQYDALGRLCAYLAPFGIEGRNGNFN